jgi:CRP-like cAMP-binding protein
MDMYNQFDLPHQFRLTIRNTIQNNPHLTRTLKVAKRSCIYVSGERDTSVYCIDSGKVKLVLYTPEGKECVLAIRTVGDIFGEACFSGSPARVETAVAIEGTRLKAMPYVSLLNTLRSESLLEGLVHYLAACIAEHEEFIASLLSLKCERRLADVLIHLGTTSSANNSHGKTIAPRILYSDLAAMVGTTRSRIGFFLRHFQEWGLVEVNADRSLTINVEKLRRFAVEGSYKRDPDACRCNNRPTLVSAAPGNTSRIACPEP